MYSNGTINNNTISYSTVGISCEWYSCPVITFNNITNNTNGIYLFEGSDSEIHWNNIHNNTNYNLTNADPRINVSATNNYWGSDPPNGIIGAVTYNPYLTTPVEEAGPE
jgi:parallel beta-helix repeat protein